MARWFDKLGVCQMHEAPGDGFRNVPKMLLTCDLDRPIITLLGLVGEALPFRTPFQMHFEIDPASAVYDK